MSIGIWQIGIVIFGLTFGILILYLLYIAGITVCEKSKKMFDKNFSYGWFGVLFGQILSVFLNEIL